MLYRLPCKNEKLAQKTCASSILQKFIFGSVLSQRNDKHRNVGRRYA